MVIDLLEKIIVWYPKVVLSPILIVASELVEHNLLPSFKTKKDPHEKERKKVQHSFSTGKGKKGKSGGRYTVKDGKAKGGKSKLTRKSSVEKIQAWARNIKKKRKVSKCHITLIQL